MKKFISLTLASLITLSAFATDGNDRFRVKVTSSEERIIMGSFLEKAKDFKEQYAPPVIKEVSYYFANIFTRNVYDGTQQSLDEDIRSYIDQQFSTIDLNALYLMDTDLRNVDRTINQFLNKSEEIEKWLKDRVPSSKHGNVDAAMAKYQDKVSDLRFRYLAERMDRNPSEQAEISGRIVKEFVEKMDVAGRLSRNDENIKGLNELIKGLEQELNTIKEASARQAKLEEIKQAKAAVEAEKLAKERAFKAQLQNMQRISTGIAALISLGDEEGAQLFSITANSGLQIAESIFSLEGATGAAAFGHYAMIATASIQILKAWGVFGGKKKDGLASALKQISKQISNMQERMDQRFDRIENQLYQNHKAVLKNFSMIHQSFASLDVAINTAINGLVDLEKSIQEAKFLEDKQRALIYLENQVDPINGKCLKKLESANVLMECISSYTAFIQNNSSSVSLTMLGNPNKRNEFVDWQLAFYADEFARGKKLSNPSVLADIEMSIEQMKNMNPHLAPKVAHMFAALFKEIKSRKNEVASMISSEDVSHSVDSIAYEVSNLRKNVSEIVKDEFNKLKLNDYKNELASVKSDLLNSIRDRENELSQVKNKTGTLDSVYFQDLLITLASMKNDVKKIQEMEQILEKRSWTEILHSKTIDFLIVIKPKNQATAQFKPVLVPLSQLRDYLPENTLSNFSLFQNATFEIDYSIKSAQLQTNLTYQQVVSSYGFSVQNSAMLPKILKYNGYFASASLKGTLSLVDEKGTSKSITLTEIVDSNSSCTKGLRRAGWFRNSVDPFALSVAFNEGFYKTSHLAESCKPLFKTTAGSLVANSATSNFDMKYEENDIKNLNNVILFDVKRALLNKTRNAIVNQGLVGGVHNLGYALNKVKGIIYFRYLEDMTKDQALLKQFQALSGNNLFESIMAQLELLIMKGNGQLMSDVSASLSKWEARAAE